MCAIVQPVPARLRLLVLQHPQEAKAPLGTARLLSLAVPRSVHRVGLSWRSLGQALGEPADTREWGVLFLGTKSQMPKQLPDGPVALLDRSGKPQSPRSLKGLVLLDGNWKQSKTLWWRNPWLLKLNRIWLNPEFQSAYGPLRKQPRRECLSTLEAAGTCLSALEGNPAIHESLVAQMHAHLERFRRRPVSEA